MQTKVSNMKIDETIIKRFEELITKGNEVKQTKRSGEWGNFYDQAKFQEWSISVLSLFERILQNDSTQITNFKEQYNNFNKRGYDMYLERCIGILQSAYNDYKNGYFFHIKNLINAELLDSVLEQANVLLKANYKDAAAIITGVALETTLNKLCENNNIELSKADKMNADLAKAGIYNKLKLKQITAWLDLRNKAAHGDWEEYTENDVKTMIESVNNFIADYL